MENAPNVEKMVRQTKISSIEVV